MDLIFRGANSKSKVGRFLEQKVKEEKEISKKLERVGFQSFPVKLLSIASPRIVGT